MDKTTRFGLIFPMFSYSSKSPCVFMDCRSFLLGHLTLRELCLPTMFYNRSSRQEVFLKVWQNSQENTSTRVFF